MKNTDGRIKGGKASRIAFSRAIEEAMKSRTRTDWLAGSGWLGWLAGGAAGLAGRDRPLDRRPLSLEGWPPPRHYSYVPVPQLRSLSIPWLLAG